MALFHRPLPRTLDAALRDLKEKSAAVRRSAIVDLGRHARHESSPRVVDAILAGMQDEDPVVRTEAAYLLGDIKATDGLASLLVAVDDSASRVRQAAIDALGQIADPRSTTRLLRATRDERPDVRFQAIIALARVSHEDGVEAAVRATNDDDPYVRYIAVRVLEEAAAVTDDETLQLDAPVADCLLARLSDDDAGVRLAAAVVLGRAGNTAGADELVRVVGENASSPEPEDEAAAISLVGTLELRAAIPGLERRAFGLRRLVRERHAWQAIVSLALLGHERARLQILRDLSSWSRQRRTAAVMAAARAHLVEALPLIEPMQHNQASADPDAVADALAKLR